MEDQGGDGFSIDGIVVGLRPAQQTRPVEPHVRLNAQQVQNGGDDVDVADLAIDLKIRIGDFAVVGVVGILGAERFGRQVEGVKALANSTPMRASPSITGVRTPR